MSCVYFILAADAGLVKIGRSNCPERRLRDMTPYSPVTLELLGSIEGPARLERQIHTLLIEHHSRNEWFAWCGVVQSHVKALLDGSFDHTLLPQRARKAWVLDKAQARLDQMERGQAA